MIAGLPMYDLGSTAPAWDAVWADLAARLRRAGVPAPPRLERGVSIDAMWRDDQLLLGQTCGYPYVKALRGRVELLGTPIFGFEGCEGPRYCSVLVARRSDARRDLAAFRGATAAINSRDSNSGMNLFRAAVAPLAGGRAFFANVVTTGAHVASLDAVAREHADIAAIDCISFALIVRERPELLERVAAIGRTPSSPGLPFIASLSLPAAVRDAVRAALAAAVADAALAAPLGLLGLAQLDDAAYEEISEMEASARALGYPELA